MKTTALKFALSTAAAAMLAVNAFAVDSTTPPVGFYTLNILGGRDNVMSLPMVRDAAFSGTVGSTVNADNFTVLSGGSSPGWVTDQFKYVAGSQRLTYYVEFTESNRTGQLKGLIYRILSNTANSLTVDTEAEDLTNRPLEGAAAALAPGDKITIRAYWNIKDAFEVSGSPIIEAWPDDGQVRDEILIPNYTTIGQNKAASASFHYDNSVTTTPLDKWRLAGDDESGPARGDTILRPNEAFVIRRRNVNPVSLANVGSVLMQRSVYFINGGSPTKKNDTYISVSRPVPVALNASGLWVSDQLLTPIATSTDVDNPVEVLLAFNPGLTGLNNAPVAQYLYLDDGANVGWRLIGDDTTDRGGVELQPGRAYIIRKKVNSNFPDWINNANY